jgi:uncharacterized membrane protein YraQ (UPF0718 family)
MTVILLTLFLYAIVALTGFLAYKKGYFEEGLKKAWGDFTDLLPRLFLGVVGSGFIAALLPPEIIREWLGAESGIKGFVIAFLAGALTPGGPVVGYSLSLGALKAGAFTPVIITYITGWSLFQLQRMIMWEMHLMERQLIIIRVLASLPLPFMMGAVYLFKG